MNRLHGRGSRTELEYRLAWAKTYLKQYGVVTNSVRGVWALTPRGAGIDRVDPREFARSVRSEHGSTFTAPPQEDEYAAQERSQETAHWRDILLEALQNMSPSGFERLCQRLLRESGFIEVEVTGRTGDGGIDGHGVIRIAGLISFTVLFQSKRYRDNIGPGIVRDCGGAMVGRADKALLISTGGFTREAQAEAVRDGASPIDLINGELLIEKLKELGLGVRTRTVEVVEVDTDWFGSM